MDAKRMQRVSGVFAFLCIAALMLAAAATAEIWTQYELKVVAPPTTALSTVQNVGAGAAAIGSTALAVTSAFMPGIGGAVAGAGAAALGGVAGAVAPVSPCGLEVYLSLFTWETKCGNDKDDGKIGDKVREEKFDNLATFELGQAAVLMTTLFSLVAAAVYVRAAVRALRPSMIVEAGLASCLALAGILSLAAGGQFVETFEENPFADEPKLLKTQEECSTGCQLALVAGTLCLVVAFGAAISIFLDRRANGAGAQPDSKIRPDAVVAHPVKEKDIEADETACDAAVAKTKAAGPK